MRPVRPAILEVEGNCESRCPFISTYRKVNEWNRDVSQLETAELIFEDKGTRLSTPTEQWAHGTARRRPIPVCSKSGMITQLHKDGTIQADLRNEERVRISAKLDSNPRGRNEEIVS
jgi:hypothetical protein